MKPTIILAIIIIIMLSLVSTLMIYYFYSGDYRIEFHKCLREIAREECGKEDLYYSRLNFEGWEYPRFDCKKNQRLSKAVIFNFIEDEIFDCKEIAREKTK